MWQQRVQLCPFHVRRDVPCADSDADADANPDSDADAYPDAHAHAYPDSDADAHPDSDLSRLLRHVQSEPYRVRWRLLRGERLPQEFRWQVHVRAQHLRGFLRARVHLAVPVTPVGASTFSIACNGPATDVLT